MHTESNAIACARAHGSIVAAVVQDALRDQFLYRQLGESFLRFETSAFTMLADASADYTGADWEFYTLSNGGFYMAPKVDTPFHLCCFGNGFDGYLSADAAGIYACAMALSHLSFSCRDERPATKFHLLRDFYCDHAEAGSLFRALD